MMKQFSDFVLEKCDCKKVSTSDKVQLFLFNRENLMRNFNFSSTKQSIFKAKEFVKQDINDNQIELFLFGKVYYRISSLPNKTIPTGENELLQLYLEKGDDFVNRIKGSFTIILYDKENDLLKIFTDQLHARTVYYYHDKSSLVISSSLSAVIKQLRKQNIIIKANHQSIFQYYLYDYVLDNNTFIENIKETEPGQIIEFSQNNLKISNYYDPLKELNLSGPRLNLSEPAEQVKNVFKKNIQLYDEGPENTAVAFTGGYDSRSVIASLGDNYHDYQYYSYGRPESWDLKIPQMIANKLKLEYSPIVFEEDFDEKFYDYGEKAVLLSDGVGRFSMANYVYVYSNFFQDKPYILTGLFGSELIKRFTGANLVMNKNMLSLLTVQSVQKASTSKFEKAWEGSFFSNEFVLLQKEAIEAQLNNHPLINNDLPQNKKIFTHFLALGIRKYFQKELKIQSPWVYNLHPFYDIDFIDALLKTPYPNVYNWELKKNLFKNLKTHKIYGALIDQKPELSNFMSTHGFKPKYLRNKLYTPLLAFDYFRYKSRIKSSSGMTFHNLINSSIDEKVQKVEINTNSIFWNMMDKADRKSPQFLKMFSLLYWFHAHDVYV